MEDYLALRKELAAYDAKLTTHPELVVLSKADLPTVREAYPDLKARFAELDVELRLISAATHEGIDELVHVMANEVAAAVQNGTQAPVVQPADVDDE
jgi:GTP-binding protein